MSICCQLHKFEGYSDEICLVFESQNLVLQANEVENEVQTGTLENNYKNYYIPKFIITLNSTYLKNLEKKEKKYKNICAGRVEIQLKKRNNRQQYNIFIVPMQLILGFKFFQKECDRYLKIDYPIDVLSHHSPLILELRNYGNKKYLLKQMTKKTNNGFKIMRRLTIAHILLMYSDEFYDFVDEFLQQPNYSSEQWLNDQCIKTYYHFLKKIVASSQYYIINKQQTQKNVNFDNMFYLANLITELFKIVAKMPLLGRYFKDSNEIVTCNFVQIIAVQSQKIYGSFKNVLYQILSNPRTFIKEREDEKIIKVVIEQSLITINEEMKKLFLDKYFYPYGKGIGIKLFKPDEQPSNVQKIINGIISDHQQTERNKQQTQLQNQLFTEDGRLNVEFYERTLRPPEKEKYQQVVIDNLEDIQEQQQLENIQTVFDATIVEEKAQKETSHHMEICEDV